MISFLLADAKFESARLIHLNVTGFNFPTYSLLMGRIGPFSADLTSSFAILASPRWELAVWNGRQLCIGLVILLSQMKVYLINKGFISSLKLREWKKLYFSSIFKCQNGILTMVFTNYLYISLNYFSIAASDEIILSKLLPCSA